MLKYNIQTHMLNSNFGPKPFIYHVTNILKRVLILQVH